MPSPLRSQNHAIQRTSHLPRLSWLPLCSMPLIAGVLWLLAVARRGRERHPVCDLFNFRPVPSQCMPCPAINSPANRRSFVRLAPCGLDPHQHRLHQWRQSLVLRGGPSSCCLHRQLLALRHRTTRCSGRAADRWRSHCTVSLPSGEPFRGSPSSGRNPRSPLAAHSGRSLTSSARRTP